MTYLAEVNTPHRAYLDQLQRYKYSLCLAVPLCLLSRMSTSKDDITGNQSIKGLLYYPCTQTFLWLIKISTARLFQRQLVMKAYKRKHFKLCQGTLIFTWIFCLGFLMQREMKSNEMYVLLYQPKEKEEEPGPSLSLSLGIHASWNQFQRKSPAQYGERHPQNHTYVVCEEC